MSPSGNCGNVWCSTTNEYQEKKRYKLHEYSQYSYNIGVKHYWLWLIIFNIVVPLKFGWTFLLLSNRKHALYTIHNRFNAHKFIYWYIHQKLIKKQRIYTSKRKICDTFIQVFSDNIYLSMEHTWVNVKLIGKFYYQFSNVYNSFRNFHKSQTVRVFL